MSATKIHNTKESKQFFVKTVLPLAKKLRNEKKAFFPEKFDAGAPTYYIKRQKTTMDRNDFVVPGCESFKNLEKALVDMWQAQGHPELASLAPGLKKLAESLYSTEDTEGEVSPYIYVMF
jgi:hypothetical protein